MKVYKTTFNLKKAEVGYSMEYRRHEGRFFRNQLEKFSCSIKRGLKNN
jgi:hypothetical protein